jgi:DNA-binding MarR family transcriptional regulator
MQAGRQSLLWTNHCLLAILVCVQASSIKKPDLVPPATEELTQALARDLLDFVNQLFTAGQRDLFAAMEDADVSITQVKTLRALAEADEPMSLGAVSETLGLSLPGISRSVDGLVRRGLVKREEDPRDRRSKLVTATGRGRSTYERLTALKLAGIRGFVADLDPEQQRALADALAPVIRRPHP